MSILDKVKKAFIPKDVLYMAKIGENAFKRQGIENASSPSSSSVIVSLAKKLGLRNGDLTSKDFEDPEYDLMVIDSAYETDSYVRQGLDKYLEQCFKEGYDFYSVNEAAQEYLMLRLSFIAEATKIPTQQLLSSMTEDVVKYSNAILLKARKQDETQIPPTTTITGIDGKEPVVGYFPAHPGTFKIKRDKNGTVQGYQQEIEGGDKPVKFRTEDVIHIPYKRKRGNAFGTPFILAVLNDVKALRFLEENVVNMVYKNVNPLLHAAVGDNDAPGTKPEVTELQRTLEGMNPEDGIATSSRVVLKAVATNNAVDPRPSLDYLEQRVFTGIGVPGIAFGRGGTANRNTADAMTAEMNDRIKAIKVTVEETFNNEIIKELLIEGGFDPLTNPDDMVYLKFRENDLDKKIKYENHQTFLFEHNVITENELRDAIDKDPITDRGGLYFELYTMPLAQMGGKQEGASTSDTNNKNKPTNQSGTKTSSKKTTNDLKIAISSKDVKAIQEILDIQEKDAILITYIENVEHISDNLLKKRILNILKRNGNFE